MAKDISTISSNSSSDSDDISLDQVTNSGVDSDRDDTSGDGGSSDDNKDKSPDNNPPSPDDTGKDTFPSDDSSSGDDEDKSGETDELRSLLTTLNDEGLDEDDQALRDQLLEKYSGSSFNEKGEIVDANGQVLATVEDVLKGINDDNAGTVNDKGDLVDAEGNILKTKAELAVENSVVNKLHSELDYEFLDEKGDVKVYSDDDAGMQEFTDDVANYKLEQFKTNFFGQHPELAEISKHILAGNSLDTFKEPVDYSQIDVKQLSPEEKENYIRESFKAGGMTDSRINAMVKRIKDSNELDAEAEEALTDLTKRDAEAKEARDAEYEQAIEKQNRQVEEHWNNVEQTINKGELHNLNVPEKDKQAFFDYVSRPANEQGQSKEMLDASNETLEQKLAFAYMRFKGYKLDDLIDSKAKTKNVLGLKERLKRSAKMKPAPANDANGITSGNDADISINEMLG